MGAVPEDDDATTSPAGWTFLTNHAHVLVCLHRDPDARLADIASRVGVRERAVQKILGDLVEEGYVERNRVGRRNHYTLHLDRPLRHPLEWHHDVGDLISQLDE